MKNNNINTEKLWEEAKNIDPLYSTKEIEDLIDKNQRKILIPKRRIRRNRLLLLASLMIVLTSTILLLNNSQKVELSKEKNAEVALTENATEYPETDNNESKDDMELGTKNNGKEFIVTNKSFKVNPLKNVQDNKEFKVYQPAKEIINQKQGSTGEIKTVMDRYPSNGKSVWHLEGPNANLFVSGKDSNEVYGGRYSAYIQAKEKSFKSAWLVQDVNAMEYSGKRVKLSAYIKCRNKGKMAWAGLFISALSDSHTVSRFDNMYDKKNVLDKWTLNEIVMDIPIKTDYLSFGFYKIYDGTAWIDNIKLELVDSNTPLLGSKNCEASDTGEKTTNIVFLNSKISMQKELTNLDLEQYEKSSFDGWQIAKESMKYRFISEKKEGSINNHVALFQGQRVDNYEWNSVFQIVDAKKYRGKRITLSADIRTEKLTNFASLWFRVDDESGNSVFDNMNDQVIKGNTKWKNYQITLDFPSNAKLMSFGAILQGNGRVWLDNFKVSVLGDIGNDDDLQSIKPQDLDFER